MKHFASTSAQCEASPWNSQCIGNNKAVANWHFAGTMSVSGEEKMRKMIGTGHAVYASFDVMDDLSPFFGSNKKGVYTGAHATSKQGGHAVSLVGYGTDNGQKWWLIQNSWGDGWADGGYAKYLRGTNLFGIETNAFFIRAWATGGEVPPCFNGQSTGISISSDGVTWTEITCAMVAGSYNHLCTGAGKETIGDACPVACGLCEAFGSDPSPPPPPPPPPPPSGCTEDRRCTGWKNYCHQGARMSDGTSFDVYCSCTCDFPAPQPPRQEDTRCPGWKAYCGKGYNGPNNDMSLEKFCPLTCR